MGQPEASARIYLLGRFGVEVDGQAIPASSWRKRRPIEVLAALALAPGRVLHREELIDRLWPDKDLEAGANNLHRALHDLRRVTNTDLIALDRGAARLVETAGRRGRVRASGGERLEGGADAGGGALPRGPPPRRSVLRPHVRDDGVYLPSSTWLIMARKGWGD